MIDLDEEWTPKKQLWCSLGAILATTSVNFTSWRRIAEWLEVYTYIWPDKRVLVPQVVDAIYRRTSKDAHSVYLMAIKLRDIESLYTEREQLVIAEIINRNLRLPKDPKTVVQFL
jgi:hypothetical protein